MATTQCLLSIVVDRNLRDRLRTEAARQGKSVSRLVREIVEERVRRPCARRARRSALLGLCGLAHGEFSRTGIDRELYGE